MFISIYSLILNTVLVSLKLSAKKKKKKGQALSPVEAIIIKQLQKNRDSVHNVTF